MVDGWLSSAWWFRDSGSFHLMALLSAGASEPTVYGRQTVTYITSAHIHLTRTSHMTISRKRRGKNMWSQVGQLLWRDTQHHGHVERRKGKEREGYRKEGRESGAVLGHLHLPFETELLILVLLGVCWLLRSRSWVLFQKLPLVEWSCLAQGYNPASQSGTSKTHCGLSEGLSSFAVPSGDEALIATEINFSFCPVLLLTSLHSSGSQSSCPGLWISECFLGKWTQESREGKGEEGKQKEGEGTHQRAFFLMDCHKQAVPEGVSIKGLLPVHLWGNPVQLDNITPTWSEGLFVHSSGFPTMPAQPSGSLFKNGWFAHLPLSVASTSII